MDKYFLRLEAKDEVVEIWRKHFPPHGNPRVAAFEVPDGAGSTKTAFGIVSDRFSGLEDSADLARLAEEVFFEMKGAIAVQAGSKDAQFSAVYERQADGGYLGTHYLKPVSIVLGPPELSGVGVVLDKDGNHKVAKPTPTLVQLALSDGNVETKAALSYFGKLTGRDWNGLYRIFDALGKVDGLVNLGVQRGNAVHLVQSLNFHRKHNNNPMNNDPLDFDDCRQILLQATQSSLRQ